MMNHKEIRMFKMEKITMDYKRKTWNFGLTFQDAEAVTILWT